MILEVYLEVYLVLIRNEPKLASTLKSNLNLFSRAKVGQIVEAMSR